MVVVFRDDDDIIILLLLSVTYFQFQTIKNFVIWSFHSNVYEDHGLME